MRRLLLTLLLFLWTSPVWAVQSYEAIDKYAKEAPPLRTKTGLTRLVQYLTKPYQTDTEKARVLLAWIVYNISYDKQKARFQGKQDVEVIFDLAKDSHTGEVYLKRGDLKVLNQEDTLQQTLKTKKGVCKDIARLYQHMCQLAGLEVEIIGGYACEESDVFNATEAHMWNAVRIDGTWYFVDPTWALQGRHVLVANEWEVKRVDRLIKTGKNIDKIKGVQKVVNEKWFLMNAEEFIQTHFPFERRWQLQKKRTTFEEFLKKSCHTTLEKFVKKM